MPVTQTPNSQAAPPEVRGALKDGIARLAAAGISSASLSAELLLMHALGCDRTWLYTHAADAIDSAAVANYFTLIARRAAGEPTQYLTGRQEFWGMEFEVTPAVLIPRPETEHLIEVAIERLGAPRSDAPLRIADVGTGSGCIAVALAKEFPAAEIIATDISQAALAVARRNAVRHNLAHRIHFIATNLLAAFHQSPVTNHQSLITTHQSLITTHQSPLFDLIASNPPYIALNDAPLLAREVREHEPAIALFGGATGTEIYARLIEQAQALLKPGGSLVIELGYGAADEVRAVVESRASFANIRITDDLAGIPRVLAADRSTVSTL
jgi:release factor glutamine methyltransferase